MILNLISFSIIFLLFVLKRTVNSVENFYSREREMLYNILDDVNAMIIVWSKDLSVFNLNDCFFNKTGYGRKYLKNKQVVSKIFNCDNFSDLISEIALKGSKISLTTSPLTDLTDE